MIIYPMPPWRSENLVTCLVDRQYRSAGADSTLLKMVPKGTLLGRNAMTGTLNPFTWFAIEKLDAESVAEDNDDIETCLESYTAHQTRYYRTQQDIFLWDMSKRETLNKIKRRIRTDDGTAESLLTQAFYWNEEHKSVFRNSKIKHDLLLIKINFTLVHLTATNSLVQVTFGH